MWLQFDIDESMNLPSSEFMKVVRILVKQLHGFGNSAEIDNTPMAALRSLAQPMMNAHMYTFLRCIIQRWPLDSSFSVVLELWLSYIQPWRYTYNRPIGADNQHFQLQQIPRKYAAFISDNIVSYSQILVQLLPRFERLDFSSFKNVVMLYRLIKVFGQPNLAELLRNYENTLFASKKVSPIKSSSANHSFNTSGSSILNRSVELSEWNTSATSTSTTSRPASPYHNRSDNYLHEDNYVHMFGPSIMAKVENLLRKMLIAREEAFAIVERLESETRKRYKGFAGYIKWFLYDNEEPENEQALTDLRKIPEILEAIIQNMGQIFEVSKQSHIFHWNCGGLHNNTYCIFH